ncbi:MAG TPA: hypothetical protein VF224_00120 [Aestuariivirga sp.]
MKRNKFSAAFASFALLACFSANGQTAFVEIAHAQSVPSTEQDAVQLIRNYYRWINQKKYAGAFGIWEKREDGNAANGQSFEKFENGFSDTASVSVDIGEPGEIEGAAGSNYIEIPVVISALTKSGQAQKFAGTYTMRSSNMADDKSWYIYSAKVRKVK